MKSQWIRILAAALLVSAVACGDDDPKTGNNTSANNTTTNNTSNNSTSPNSTTPNNATTVNNNTAPNNMGGTADVTEVEPNGFGETDTPTPFTAGQSVGGTIAAGAGETADFDRFSFSAEAGQVLTVSVDAAGPGTQDLGADQLVIVVVSEDESVVRQLLTSEGLTSREIFLPIGGTYFLEVLDERAGGDAMHGGDDATYVIGTSISAPEPDALALPSSTDGDLSDGGIAAFTLNSAEETVVDLETFANRLDTPTALDTVLVVFDPASGTLVSSNDDFLPAEQEIYDSNTAFRAAANTDYLVIVDSYSATTDGGYRLEASVTDDSPAAPTTIASGDSVTGDIAAVDGTEFDTDYFEVTLQRNEIVRIEVTAADQFQPNIRVLFNGTPFAEARPVAGSAAVEIAAGDFEDPQTFAVTLDDFRNTPPDMGAAQNVGGAGFDYTLAVTTVAWTPTAVTLPYSDTGTIATVGNTNFYSFDLAAGQILIADVITTETDFTPQIVQINEQNFDVPVDAPFITSAPEMTSFVFGIRDEFFRGYAAADYLVDFTAVTPSTLAETEPNDDQAGAEALTVPARATGVLDGTNETATSPDWFSFSATTGQTIALFTEPGTDMATEDADTVITLYDANGMELDTNDDISFGNTFSAINYEAMADGTYFVKVEPYCGASDCSGNGDYSLVVVTN